MDKTSRSNRLMLASPLVALLGTVAWVAMVCFATTAELNVEEANLGPNGDASLYGLAYLLPIVVGVVTILPILGCCVALAFAKGRRGFLTTNAWWAAGACLLGALATFVVFVSTMESSWASTAGTLASLSLAVAMVPAVVAALASVSPAHGRSDVLRAGRSSDQLV